MRRRSLLPCSSTPVSDARASASASPSSPAAENNRYAGVAPSSANDDADASKASAESIPWIEDKRAASNWRALIRRIAAADSAARLIVVSNRMVKEMGFDWFDQLERAPGF